MVGVADVRAVRVAAAALARALEPDAVPLPDVVPMWEELDALERHAAAAKTLFSRRVEESKAWQRAGHRSAAEFLAARAGSSIGAARAQLDVSKKVQSLPATAQALREGELSGAQASVMVDAAAANPAAEQQLLGHARRASFAELREESLRVRAAADTDREATQRRIHGQRCLRTWTDAEGAWNLAARGTVADGSRIMGVLQPLIDRGYTKARGEERREEREAYAFDALVALATRKPADAPPAKKRANPSYLGLIRLDFPALQRGYTRDGELCEITGLGSIPVSTARELLGESILKLVITKGTDVLHVTHLGRGPSAAQRVALFWSSPGCSVEGCPRTRVEIDHRIPYAETRHTRLDECDPLCTHHHDRKTLDDWALVEGTGKRPMVPSDDPRHPKNRPRPDTS